MKNIKKILFILLLIMCTLPLFSQELNDVNSIIRPISSIYKTKYGVIVYYPNYTLDVTTLYIPNAWFLPPNSRSKDDSKTLNIYAKLEPLYKNLNAPFLEFFYHGAEIKEIRVHLTQKDIDTPISYLPRKIQALDIESLFSKQELTPIVEVR